VRRLVMLLLTAALIMGACGGSSSNQPSGNAEGTLLASLLKLQNSPSTVTLTFRSDPESLQALASQGGGGSITTAEANKILASSVTVSHNNASNPRDARSETIINIAGDSNAIEMRMVNRTLYVRADAGPLLKMFGAKGTDLQRQIHQAESSGLTFLKPALEGKWLSFAGLDKLAAQSGATAPSAGKQSQAANALLQKLLGAATVSTAGSDAAGTHLVVTVPARQAYTALRGALANLSGAMPPAALPDATAIPDKNIKLDAWVKDGSLTQMEVDLTQFAALGHKPLPAGVHTLALHMTFRDFAGTISAPSGAVSVDLQGLTKSLMGSAVGSGSSASSTQTAMPVPGGTNIKCSALVGMRPKDIRSLLSGSPARLKALARACPSLHLQA
jgi:hypothetical protein